MEIDQIGQQLSSEIEIEIESDGLLLYVSQASYEHGTSPLSTWIPVVSYSPGKPSPLSIFEKYARALSFLDKMDLLTL